MQYTEEEETWNEWEAVIERRRQSFSSCSSFLSIRSGGFSCKSLSYDKLPQVPLTLSILKLDGSSFDVEVPRTATVGELKQVIQLHFIRHVSDNCNLIKQQSREQLLTSEQPINFLCRKVVFDDVEDDFKIDNDFVDLESQEDQIYDEEAHALSIYNDAKFND